MTAQHKVQPWSPDPASEDRETEVWLVTHQGRSHVMLLGRCANEELIKLVYEKTREQKWSGSCWLPDDHFTVDVPEFPVRCECGSFVDPARDQTTHSPRRLKCWSCGQEGLYR